MFIHSSAEVETGAIIGEGTKIWHLGHIRRDAFIGKQCVIGRGVFIDSGVRIGNRVKIQNYVSVYHGVRIEDGVFVGPYVCFTNDLWPRAVDAEGNLKQTDDWVVSETLIRSGASLGANATVVCGVTVGSWAMVGAGSVVCKDVPDYALVVGNPASVIGYVSPSGRRVETPEEAERIDRKS